MVKLKMLAACVGFTLAAAPAMAVDLAALPALPSAAEKRAFLDYLLKNWSFDRDAAMPDCAPLLAEMRKGGVVFLEPDAAGALERPRAVQDIDRKCALDIGTNLQQGPGGISGAPMTREELIDAYGKPKTATRNFTLYHVRLKDSPAVMTVHFAERLCDDSGVCSYFPSYDLLDLDHCRKEMIEMPTRYGAADSDTTGSITGLLRIKGDVFILWAGVAKAFGAMMREEWPDSPAITLSKLPGEVERGRNGKGAACSFASPQTPHKDARIRPPPHER